MHKQRHVGLLDKGKEEVSNAGPSMSVITPTQRPEVQMLPLRICTKYVFVLFCKLEYVHNNCSIIIVYFCLNKRQISVFDIEEN